MYDDSPDWFEVKSSKFADITFDSYQNFARERFNFSNDDPTWRTILKPATIVREIVANVCKDNTKAYSYTPSIGTPPSREAVLKLFELPSHIKSSDIYLTIGRELAISTVVRAICNPGDKFLVPAPCDPYINLIATRYNFTAIPYEIDDDGKINLDQVHDILSKDPSIKFVFLMNPLVPTGAVISPEHLDAFTQVTKKHGTITVCDESYRNFLKEGAPFKSITEAQKDLPNIVVVDIGIQFLAPGWRTGAVIFNDPGDAGILSDIAAGVQTLSQILIHPSSIIQGSMQELTGFNQSEYLKKSIMPLVEENFKVLSARVAACKGLRIVSPKASHFGILRLTPEAGMTASELSKKLEATGVRVVAGHYFGGRDDFIRVEFSGETRIYEELGDILVKTVDTK